jgi:hypothetical protein
MTAAAGAPFAGWLGGTTNDALAIDGIILSFDVKMTIHVMK